jgi:hypothetical protein
VGASLRREIRRTEAHYEDAVAALQAFMATDEGRLALRSHRESVPAALVRRLEDLDRSVDEALRDYAALVRRYAATRPAQRQARTRATTRQALRQAG